MSQPKREVARMVEDEQGKAAFADGIGRGLTVGALLAEARAAAGRDLADLARETRVPLRHLMAIEADDHEALPALPYAMGFVKTFARSVGLNPEAVGAQFRAETRLTPHVPTPPSLEPMDEARLPSRGLAFAGAAVLVLVVGGLGLYGSGVLDPAPSAPPVAASPDAAPPNAASQADKAPADVAAAPPTAAPAAAAPAAIPTVGAVVLTAREDVWVKIYSRTTGRRAFQGLMVAGSIYNVPGDQGPLVLRAGRAGVIDVTVAGVKLPSLGGPVETIDGVVLTAPALAERFGAATPVQAPESQAGASRAAPSPATR
ncbi:helix-turn-helix domain-containing protein [Sandarakinorhabdus sp. AAP62]|uniref:helix-turn-helix domain-containing protein n=1 Tax=Sandarakinorhabdus sp. AAP62 TaxID=1248916 RepID=UPI00187CC338|nr:helix-turn-helix domain-containing protein [Sandarakinorhabdus sp. AAP62]